MTSKAWLNDKAIKEWLQKIHSERTRENYRREFPKYLDFVKANTEYKTPSQIIEARIKQDATQTSYLTNQPY